MSQALGLGYARGMRCKRKKKTCNCSNRHFTGQPRNELLQQQCYLQSMLVCTVTLVARCRATLPPLYILAVFWTKDASHGVQALTTLFCSQHNTIPPHTHKYIKQSLYTLQDHRTTILLPCLQYLHCSLPYFSTAWQNEVLGQRLQLKTANTFSFSQQSETN